MTLEVTSLSIALDGRRVVDDVSFDVADGARVGLIGESGSGKSLTALAVLGLLPDGAEVAGSIRWNGRELLGLRDRELAALRGEEIGIVFQEPQTALNPLRTVGRQIAEPLRIHGSAGRREALARAQADADRVRLPEGALRRYPHQLSGGQRQRVAGIEASGELFHLLGELVDDDGMSLLFITHDLAVLSQVATEAVVLERGRVVETGAVADLLTAPRSEVTRGLLRDATATVWRPEGDA